MDLICYSHLRWDFVYQRPQHILTRMATHFRVFFVEEPVFDASTDYIEQSSTREAVVVITPHLCQGYDENTIVIVQQRLLKVFFDECKLSSHIAWFYTPMALPISLANPVITVYDCMDELAAFKNAPSSLSQREAALFALADIVFTGGRSLFEKKKHQHSNIYLFPSSIDKTHFWEARASQTDPFDQLPIPHPRIGFFGVVDERMDLRLVADIAALRPDWHFIFIGPVVKIEAQSLPTAPNIHWFGKKEYHQLPAYISGWQAAMMPFAINDSTRYISPTKTPEYLAAGKPVVSTAVKDVVDEYGNSGLVYIAATAEEFIEGMDAVNGINANGSWLKSVDAVLGQNSWDVTVEKMLYLVNLCIADKTTDNEAEKKKEKQYV